MASRESNAEQISLAAIEPHLAAIKPHIVAITRNILPVTYRIILGMPVDLAHIARRERILLAFLEHFLRAASHERDPKSILSAASNDLRAAKDNWQAAGAGWRADMVELQTKAIYFAEIEQKLQVAIKQIPLLDLFKMANCGGNSERTPRAAIQDTLLVATNHHLQAMLSMRSRETNSEGTPGAATVYPINMAGREGKSEEVVSDTLKLMSLPSRIFVDNICSMVEANILDFISVHSLIARCEEDDKMRILAESFLSCLDGHIARSRDQWRQIGCFMGIVTMCSLLEYEEESNVLMRAMAQRSNETDVAMDRGSIQEATPSKSFTQALDFTVKMYDMVVRRWGDTNTLPFVHTVLVFILKMTQYPSGILHLEQSFPWKSTMLMLNYHLETCGFEPCIDTFPGLEKGGRLRALPEDYAMRDVPYAADYYPKELFNNGEIDEDRSSKLPSMTNQRKERILYLGRQIAALEKWLTFDTDSNRFGVTIGYDVDVGNVVRHSPPPTPELIESEEDSESETTQRGRGTAEARFIG